MPASALKAVFIDWPWLSLRDVPDLVVPFKRGTYAQIVREFEKFAKR